MNRIDTEEDGAYNFSSKYISFDENGRPIEYGSNPNQGTKIPIAEYSAVFQSASGKEKLDDKYVQIVNSRNDGKNKVGQNIEASGAAYALPYNSKDDQDTIEDDDNKYINQGDAGPDYINLGPTAIGPDYVNLDPNAIGTDYVNLDPNPTGTDYVNLDPNAIGSDCATLDPNPTGKDYANLDPKALYNHENPGEVLSKNIGKFDFVDYKIDNKINLNFFLR